MRCAGKWLTRIPTGSVLGRPWLITDAELLGHPVTITVH
jgi:hypothetical protein